MPEADLRVSVRRVAEFALRGGDLLPASAAAMQQGARAHRARQADAQAAAERALRWQGECEGLHILVQGRADLLWEDRDPPCIEELKLTDAHGPAPLAAVPVHRLQAVCYGFLLCEEQALAAVEVQVSYVTEQGAVRSSFSETLTHEEARSCFFEALRPLARWEAAEQAYRRLRNASIAALPFPYAAYRPGQREMAVQVYTAIARCKRLFATLPTGTGKSAAALFPALKALGEGKTQQIFCLTARGTAQLSAQDALARMRAQGLILRSTVLTAREKCCPVSPMRCHPDHCPRAKGYFDREVQALLALQALPTFDTQAVRAVAERWQLCPFEFSLAACELSDAVICDYNYAFDPTVSLRRIIGQGLPVTLLIDEAHNLPARTRDMLSAALDSRALSSLRRETGRLHGRGSALYQAMTRLLTPLRTAESAADALTLADALDPLIAAMAEHTDQPQAEGYGELFRALLQFRMALQRMREQPQDYRVLIKAGARERQITLLCLDVSAHLRTVTRRMRGCVCYSATLSPPEAMRTLLGGDEEDAIFALPSPFPPERLLVLHRSVTTRYRQRTDSAEAIAQSLLALYAGRSGKYIAYFPSYAYLALVSGQLLALAPDLPLNQQERGMDEAARARFLHRMQEEAGPLLSLCVLGGVFSEGIDLPGAQLIGAAVVGVGLPQVNEAQEALREHYQQTLGDGFGYAYRYPGMHKVLQAAGRVIRSERDAGVLLLLDDRYGEPAYASLLPPHYRPVSVKDENEIRLRAQTFWQTLENNPV